MEKKMYNLTLIGTIIMGLALIVAIYFGIQQMNQTQETQPVKPTIQNVTINQYGNGTIESKTE